MSYEHQQEVNLAANRLAHLIDLALDKVPDQEQLLAFAADASAALAAVSGAIKAEDKEAYKAKVFLKLGIQLANKAVDRLLPDANS